MGAPRNSRGQRSAALSAHGWAPRTGCRVRAGGHICKSAWPKTRIIAAKGTRRSLFRVNEGQVPGMVLTRNVTVYLPVSLVVLKPLLFFLLCDCTLRKCLGGGEDFKGWENVGHDVNFSNFSFSKQNRSSWWAGRRRFSWESGSTEPAAELVGLSAKQLTSIFSSVNQQPRKKGFQRSNPSKENMTTHCC